MAVAGGEPQEGLTVGAARERFARFIELNPWSKIEEQEGKPGRPVVRLPWGDDTIELRIPVDFQKSAEALNNVILPERFTAIYHTDSRDLEIIYTAFPLHGTQKDLIDRGFLFSFEGTELKCEFGRASDRLLQIAEDSHPIDVSHTQHRNLASFSMYVSGEKGKASEKLPDAMPFCFWVRGVNWDEEKFARIAMHINFYMSYFDTASPTINIFPPKFEQAAKPRERYMAGYFPKTILARELNTNLLHYWGQARISDASRRFQYCYQIVEYVSFYFVEEGVKNALRKALTMPHAFDELDNLIAEIVDSVVEMKTWEGTKMQRLLREAVEAALVWRELDKNRDYFSKPQEFDGGFHLRPLIGDKETAESFSRNWEDKFVKDFRDIRNALAHGREQTTAGVIAPTPKNLALIQPWANLATVLAGQVMVWKRAVV